MVHEENYKATAWEHPRIFHSHHLCVNVIRYTATFRKYWRVLLLHENVPQFYKIVKKTWTRIRCTNVVDFLECTAPTARSVGGKKNLAFYSIVQAQDIERR